MPTNYPQKHQYQVGGSLSESAGSYVVRQVDRALYEGILARKFCYVLNSRQMGKSSLRVRTMAKLKHQGFACAALEMRELCGYQVTQDEFYGGLISHLVNEFNLEIDLESWWSCHQFLHSSLRFSYFLETVLLKKIAQNIAIFIDEVDSIIGLDFKDDFFTVLQHCYRKRVLNSDYDRLSFALFGVAAPAELITDPHRNPFTSESCAIELAGFQLDEAMSLEVGFVAIADSPRSVLAEVLLWTGGQPFLTQWLCQLLVQTQTRIPSEQEKSIVATVVRSRILENWLLQDQQQHLQTIRDRLLAQESLTCRLLGLYQQILHNQAVTANDSFEIMQLQLSGLVVKRQQQLFVYNQIYASIFNLQWIEQQLENIRPYADEFRQWEASRQAPRYLLEKESLIRALEWAQGKSLSNRDYQFLSASQQAELSQAQQQTQLAIKQEHVAQQRLTEATSRAKKVLRFGFATTALTVLLGFVAVIVMPQLAIFFNNRGTESDQANQFQNAIQNYNIALMIKPGYAQALYNRGRTEERLGNFNNARMNYESAVDAAYAPAYSSLARLYILKEQKYTQAIELLEKGLQLPSGDIPENILKSAILKNLGWVHLELKQYDRAEAHLRDSIALENRVGSSHCLLAKVLEVKQKAAQTEWQQCQKLASQNYPEDRRWLQEAKIALKKYQEKQP